MSPQFDPSKRKFLTATGIFAGTSLFPLSGLGSAKAQEGRLASTVTRPSDQLVHNLRFEGMNILSSSLRSSGQFADDAETIKAHMLEALNEGSFKHIRVRSGGHSYIGSSIAEWAYVLDLEPFHHIEVNTDEHTMRVGAGCRFYQVTTKLASLGAQYFLPTGDCPTVSVGGYFLGGGISLLSPVLGFGVDRVLELTMLVFKKYGSRFEARTIKANRQENADLFWAAMGGGAQIGIVTDLVLSYALIENHSIYHAHFTNQNPEAFAKIFSAWDWLCQNRLGPSTSSKLQIDNFKNISIMGVTVNNSGDYDHIEYLTRQNGGWVERKPLALDKLYETVAGCRQLNECATTAWTSQPEFFSAKSSLLEQGRTLTWEQLLTLGKQLQETPECDYAYLQFMRWAGLMKQDDGSVSFPHRNVNYGCQVSAKTQQRERSAFIKSYDQWVDSMTSQLGPRKAAYFNHTHKDVQQEPETYFGKSWDMLQRVKAVYDPDKIFDAFSPAR